jgi:HlyD family secretion protein
MDKPRVGQARKRRLRYTLFAIVALAVVLSITIAVSRLEPAAPTAEKETLLIDKVKRGPMLRQVRGPGTLVPVDIRSIATPVQGRIERIHALPGAPVQPDTVLLEMSNPELEQNALEAESQVQEAQADYDTLRAQLDSQLLNQQATVTQTESQAEEAKLQAEADEKLAKDGLIPELNLKLSRLRATQTSKQARIERERFLKNQRSNQTQLAAQRARVDQARAMYDLRRRQLESLKVRAGIHGVLQELEFQEVGRQVTPGQALARVARPELLKAELRIPETQAKDVTIGLNASIDTRNGIVPGHVIRVAPSVQEGSVTVDVALDGPLPKGARPDLSVDGTIEIERLDDVVYVGRPAYGQAESKIEMFKLVEEGTEAVRVPVVLGRSSVREIEIRSGLNPGDQVILSDMSQYDEYNRVRVK